MDQIMTRVSDASAKIVMVGDARQLQPIDAGGPFAALGRELGRGSTHRDPPTKRFLDARGCEGCG